MGTIKIHSPSYGLLILPINKSTEKKARVKRLFSDLPGYTVGLKKV